MSARLPHERPAHVVITREDGSSLQAEVGVNRGDDAFPYSREELRGKFMDLTQRVWAPGHCARVLEATLALAEPGASFGQWTALLRNRPRLTR